MDAYHRRKKLNSWIYLWPRSWPFYNKIDGRMWPACTGQNLECDIRMGTKQYHKKAPFWYRMAETMTAEEVLAMQK